MEDEQGSHFNVSDPGDHFGVLWAPNLTLHLPFLGYAPLSLKPGKDETSG